MQKLKRKTLSEDVDSPEEFKFSLLSLLLMFNMFSVLGMLSMLSMFSLLATLSSRSPLTLTLLSPCDLF